jgi:hypothetical protein
MNKWLVCGFVACLAFGMPSQPALGQDTLLTDASVPGRVRVAKVLSHIRRVGKPAPIPDDVAAAFGITNAKITRAPAFRNPCCSDFFPYLIRRGSRVQVLINGTALDPTILSSLWWLYGAENVETAVFKGSLGATQTASPQSLENGRKALNFLAKQIK